MGQIRNDGAVGIVVPAAVPFGVPAGKDIPGAFKLAAVARLDGCQRRFDFTAGENFEGVRIELFQPIAFDVAQALAEQEFVVQTNFGVDCRGGVHPVNRPLDLATVGRLSAFGFRVVGANQLDNLAVFVFDEILALEIVRPAKSNFLVRRETEITFDRLFHEVRLFDVNSS